MASFTRTPAQLQGPRVLSTLTRPAWDACDGLESEDLATDVGVNVILETLAEAFQGEHETELFDALEDTFCGLAGRRVRDSMTVHFGYKATYGSRPSKEYGCQTNYRQGFLLLRRANLSTQARIAVMTLAGNNLSFGDTRGPQTVYMSHAKEAKAATEEQEGDTDVETALAALNEDNDTD